MNLPFALRIAGMLLLLLAVAHVPIARRLEWRTDAHHLSPINRQVMLSHAFFIGLAVALMGVLTLGWARELATPAPLAAPLAGGLALFWGARLYFQWFVFDRPLWRHKPFETAVHIVFTLLWTYLTLVYAWCFRVQITGL